MKKYISVVLSLLISISMMLTACSNVEREPDTLESLVSSNQEVAGEINKSAEESGISVDVKDNTVTYTYDVSNVDGVTDEMIEDEDFIKSFQTSLDAQGPSFRDVCSDLEEKTGIQGVSVHVVYLYKDKEIASATFTSSDADESEDTKKSDDSSNADDQAENKEAA